MSASGKNMSAVQVESMVDRQSHVEVCQALRNREQVQLPLTNYIETVQNASFDITRRREIVIWLHQLSQARGLSPVTVAQAVNIFDRYLSLYTVDDENGDMLVAAACLFMCSKLTEHCAVSTMDLLHSLEYAFRASDIEAMELTLLQMLNWDTDVVTPHELLPRYASHFELEAYPQLVKIAFFLLDLASSEYRFLKYMPSVQAAAAMIFAREQVSVAQDTLEEEDSVHSYWLRSFQNTFGIDPSLLDECHTEMRTAYENIGNTEC